MQRGEGRTEMDIECAGPFQEWIEAPHTALRPDGCPVESTLRSVIA